MTKLYFKYHLREDDLIQIFKMKMEHDPKLLKVRCLSNYLLDHIKNLDLSLDD